MKRRSLIAMAGAMTLGACAAPGDMGAGQSAGVPEAVLELAAPYQDLETARLRAEDGCYWYLHAGRVETTLLPLRTVDGRPICTATTVEKAG